MNVYVNRGGINCGESTELNSKGWYNLSMNVAQMASIKPKAVVRVSKKALTQRQNKTIKDTITALINTPTKKECAKFLKISEQNLYKRLSQYPQIMEGVTRFVESVREDSRRKLVLTSPRAVDKIEHLMENATSENIQLEASKDILDRAGIIKPVNNNIQVNILNDLKKDADTYQ